MGRTPPGGGDLIEAKPLCLVTQPLTQVEMPGALPFGRHPAALHDLRTYFIALTTNTYPTVHYNIRPRTPSETTELLHSPAEDPASGAAPPGVEQSHPSSWNNEIDRDAIGDRYGQEDPWRGSDPAVYPLDLDPPASGIQTHHLDPVHLVAQRNGREFGQRVAERAPATHHIPNRCGAPEAEIEPTTGLGAASGDAGNDTVTFAPTRDLEPGDGSGNWGLADL